MSAAFDAVVAGWTAWMAPISAHALLLVLVVLVLDRALSRSSWPALRGVLWTLVVLRLALPPSVTSPIALVPALDGIGRAPGLPSAGMPADAVTVLERALFSAWLGGALAAAGLELVRRRRFRRSLEREGTLVVPRSIERALVEAARAVGLRRPPALRITELVGGPATFGVFRPVVLLPAECVALFGSTEIRHVLLHECAHVRRKDLASDALLRALQIVYWFHPAAWLARARLAGLRELACDAAVASVLRERAGEYRETLLAAARRRLEQEARTEPGALAFLREPANVILRLRALERGSSRNPRLRRAGAGALFVLLAPTLVLSPNATVASAPFARSTEARFDAGGRAPVGTAGAAGSAGLAGAIDAAGSASERAADELARETLVQAARGEGGPGCLRLRLAALQLASAAVRSPAR